MLNLKKRGSAFALLRKIFVMLCNNEAIFELKNPLYKCIGEIRIIYMGYEKIVTLAERCAKYAQVYGGKSILATKPIGKINPSGLGVCLPNGTIHFQNEKSAVRYIFNRLKAALDLPDTQQFERVIAKRGTTIIGEGNGTHASASLAFQNIKGILERTNSNVPRDLEVFHSHPDMFGKGRTTPLSSFLGDIGTFFNAKLKKIVAVNSNGEYNSLEVAKGFSPEKFKMFEKKFDDIYLKSLVGDDIAQEYKKLSQIRDQSYIQSDVVWTKDMSQRFRDIFSLIAKKDRQIRNTEEIARINHEAYKYADNFGLHYETNFSNLLKFDA